MIRTDKTVDTHSPSTSGRKSVLEGGTESLINNLCLIITEILVLGLLSKTLALDVWVVQLSVSIANFSLVDEKLEAFC